MEVEWNNGRTSGALKTIAMSIIVIVIGSMVTELLLDADTAVHSRWIRAVLMGFVSALASRYLLRAWRGTHKVIQPSPKPSVEDLGDLD